MKSWIPSSVIYQVNLRALAAREPRNPIEAAAETALAQSPLAYLTGHLETVRALGVSVLHLMPPFEMGVANRKGIGSPYAARDYTSIDPEYGTFEEFSDFVRNAHRAGFRIILGLVPNHTSRDHVWMEGHPEFYVRDDAGVPVYDLDWTDTAKLDYRSPALRAAMAEVMAYWLTFLTDSETDAPDGVDGFRFDMAHFINDRSFWNDTLPALQARHPGREFLFLAECYGMENNLDLFERGMTAAYDDAFYKNCEYFYATNAAGDSVLVPDPALTSDPDLASLSAAFATRGIAGVMEDALSLYVETLKGRDAPRFLARYTDNHDEGRGVYRYGAGAVRAVNTLSFLSPNALPFLLTGQEFGASNRPSIHERIQPCDKGRRVLGAHGVTRMEGVEFEGNLFARGADQRAAWYAFYRELIALRGAHPALVDGEFAPVDMGEEGAAPERTVVSFDRWTAGERLRCAVNMGPVPRMLTNNERLAGEVIYGRMDGGSIPAFSGLVVSVEV